VKSDADSHAIYRSLKEFILRDGATPGSRLPTERALASHFGAARNTVRNIMKRLEVEGLIVRHVGRGTFVAQDEACQRREKQAEAEYTLRELAEARLFFEPFLAEVAAECATDEELAALSAHLDAMSAAKTWPDFKEAKYALHLAIVRISRNRFMIDIFERIIASRRAVSWDGGDSRPLGAGVVIEVADNAEVVEALQKRNGARARELLRTNLLRILAFAGGT
jgi:DNA-binding FadR family transcriptional regulator